MRELALGVQRLGPADYRRMRWKNGRGWTTEIAVHPADADLNGKPFDWRVSLAEVESDGEFSAFPGYDRTILLAEGAGMELSFDAAPARRITEPYVPFRFKGEWRANCRLLDGPVWDFNVMSARGKYQHHCEIMRNPALAVPVAPETQTLIAYSFQGKARIQIAGKMQCEFEPGEALLVTREAGLRDLYLEMGAAKITAALVVFIAVA